MAGIEEDVIDDVVKWGAIGLVGYLVLKTILNQFLPSDTDKATVSDQANQAAADNCFSASFQPFVDLYSQTNNWLGGGSLSGMMTSIKAGWDNGTYANSSSAVAVLAGYAERVKNDEGYIINYYDDVIAVFNSVQYQTDVAFIAGYLNVNYGVDLLTWLNNGPYTFIISGGLSTSQVAAIVNRVNSLPESAPSAN